MKCPACDYEAVPGEVTDDVCPKCERPYRSQPTPINSEMKMRNMPAPGEEDMGGNPLQEGILGDWQNKMVRDESYASVKKEVEDEEPEFEIEAVLPPDPESLRPDNKRSTMQREAFLPALLGLAGGVIGRNIAGGLVGRALGQGAASGVLGNAAKNFGMLHGAESGIGLAQQYNQAQQPGQPAQPGVTGPQQVAAPAVQPPSYYSHFLYATETFESPSSQPTIPGNETNDYDTKEHKDGDNEPLDSAQDVNDIGGSDQGFSEGSPGHSALLSALPKLIQFIMSPNPGKDDPELGELHNILESEQPGYLDDGDEDAAGHFLMMVVNGGQDKEGDGLKDNEEPHDPISEKESNLVGDPLFGDQDYSHDTCPKCGGAIDPSSQQCPQCGLGNAMTGPQGVNTNQSPHIAADTQGPKTAEQQAAVAELLLQEGREDEVSNMILNPQDYADELAQITNQEAPPEGPDPQQPQPPAEEAPPESTMPMPGMSAPPQGGMGMPGMMAALKERGVEVTAADEHVQQHGDNFDNQIGVDAADVTHQEDSELEQDSGHTWVDDDGNPLEVGKEYEMYSDKYDIPDMVRIEHVKPDSIEYTLTGEYGIEHRNEITHEESMLENLHFVSAHSQSDAELEDPGLEQNMEDVGRPAPGMDQTDLSTPHSTMSHAKEANPSMPPQPGVSPTPSVPPNGMPAPAGVPTGQAGPVVNGTCPQCGSPEPCPMHGAGAQPPMTPPATTVAPTVAQTKTATELCPQCGQPMDESCPGCGYQPVNPQIPPTQMNPHPEQQYLASEEETGPEWLADELRTAGAKFTPTEQRDFIDEDGVARNADKLDLAGTHYESRADSIDDQFLFGL